MPLQKPTYDVTKSYDWNYDYGPVFEGVIPKRVTDPKFSFLGFKLNSRRGVPAGPLLNSNYIKLYAALGFDVLAYKTVRSVERVSHPNPNCLYIRENYIDPKKQGEEIVVSDEPDDMSSLSITNSFGMPSKSPDIWQDDVKKAKGYMGEGQVLIVSVVGTNVPERSYIDDWAYVAKMAKENGADSIELDISCPNVSSGAGEIYQDANLTKEIVVAVRKEIGNTPLLLKIGYIEHDTALEKFITTNGYHVDGIAAINTLRMKVVDAGGNQALPGEGRLYAGVCGAAIQNAGLDMVRRIAALREKFHMDYVILGVGGIVKPEDFEAYYTAGADIAMSATGAMWNPYLSLQSEQ